MATQCGPAGASRSCFSTLKGLIQMVHSHGEHKKDGHRDARSQLGHHSVVLARARCHRLVGGQLTLAALVPVLRKFGADVPRAAARRFNQVDWVSFTALIATGVWNIVAARSQISNGSSYRVTLIVKLVVVAISGVTAALHGRARSTMGLAVFGALTGVSALVALFVDVILAG
jgi:hypothetical protein